MAPPAPMTDGNQRRRSIHLHAPLASHPPSPSLTPPDPSHDLYNPIGPGATSPFSLLMPPPSPGPPPPGVTAFFPNSPRATPETLAGRGTGYFPSTGLFRPLPPKRTATLPAINEEEADQPPELNPAPLSLGGIGTDGFGAHRFSQPRGRSKTLSYFDDAVMTMTDRKEKRKGRQWPNGRFLPPVPDFVARRVTIAEGMEGVEKPEEAAS